MTLFEKTAEKINPGTGALFALSAFVVILDQLTKYLCNSYLVEGVPFQVFPGLDFVLAYNSGAAFSFLSDAGGWQRWLLRGISLSVSLVLAVWLYRLPRTQKLLGFSLALILGGAVGNLYDRMLAGYVIDFISVYFMEYRFATFNVADSAISIGAGLMLLDIFLDHKKSKSSTAPG